MDKTNNCIYGGPNDNPPTSQPGGGLEEAAGVSGIAFASQNRPVPGSNGRPVPPPQTPINPNSGGGCLIM